MSKMSEVYRLYLEEKRYERDLKEDTFLDRIAYTKGFTQQPTPKGTNNQEHGTRNK